MWCQPCIIKERQEILNRTSPFSRTPSIRVELCEYSRKHSRYLRNRNSDLKFEFTLVVHTELLNTLVGIRVVRKGSWKKREVGKF